MAIVIAMVDFFTSMLDSHIQKYDQPLENITGNLSLSDGSDSTNAGMIVDVMHATVSS